MIYSPFILKRNNAHQRSSVWWSKMNWNLLLNQNKMRKISRGLNIFASLVSFLSPSSCKKKKKSVPWHWPFNNNEIFLFWQTLNEPRNLFIHVFSINNNFFKNWREVSYSIITLADFAFKLFTDRSWIFLFYYMKINKTNPWRYYLNS